MRRRNFVLAPCLAWEFELIKVIAMERKRLQSVVQIKTIRAC